MSGVALPLSVAEEWCVDGNDEAGAHGGEETFGARERHVWHPRILDGRDHALRHPSSARELILAPPKRIPERCDGAPDDLDPGVHSHGAISTPPGFTATYLRRWMPEIEGALAFDIKLVDESRLL